MLCYRYRSHNVWIWICASIKRKMIEHCFYTALTKIKRGNYHQLAIEIRGAWSVSGPCANLVASIGAFLLAIGVFGLSWRAWPRSNGYLYTSYSNVVSKALSTANISITGNLFSSGSGRPYRLPNSGGISPLNHEGYVFQVSLWNLWNIVLKHAKRTRMY